MNSPPLIASMSIDEDGPTGFFSDVIDLVFSVPFWMILAVFATPVVLVLFQRRSSPRTFALVGIATFLWSAVLCYVMPLSAKDLFAAKQYWRESPESSAFVGLIVTTVAPIAFFLITLFVVRRAKTWMNSDE